MTIEELPISELKLSRRVQTCLEIAGISTIGDLTRRCRQGIWMLSGIGPKAMEEIIERLADHDLRLDPLVRPTPASPLQLSTQPDAFGKARWTLIFYNGYSTEVLYSYGDEGLDVQLDAAYRMFDYLQYGYGFVGAVRGSHQLESEPTDDKL